MSCCSVIGQKLTGLDPRFLTPMFDSNTVESEDDEQK